MIPYLNEFLVRYSPRGQNQIRNRLQKFSTFLIKRNKSSILLANYEDIYAFFKDIDKMNVKKSAKEFYRSNINMYYETIIERKRSEGIEFKNPVPSLLGFEFSDEKDKETDGFDQKYLTYETIERILKFYFFTDYNLFILMSLVAYTGARISEICTIRIADIDLKNRKIVSGREPGFSKTGLVLYFYPEFFKDTFSKFVEERSANEFLFPTIQKKTRDFIGTTTINKKLIELKTLLKIEDPINPHSFRDAINTYRLMKGLSETFSSILLNQKPKTVNIQFYTKRFKNWKPLQELYDQYFPYPPLIL